MKLEREKKRVLRKQIPTPTSITCGAENNASLGCQFYELEGGERVAVLSWSVGDVLADYEDQVIAITVKENKLLITSREREGRKGHDPRSSKNRCGENGHCTG